MMMRPKYTKPDANQEQIVTELRELGYDVDDVHDLPGIFDIIVSGLKYQDIQGNRSLIVDYAIPCSVRVEIKSEDGKLHDTEVEYHASQNHPGSLIVARSTGDVLEWFGAI